MIAYLSKDNFIYVGHNDMKKMNASDVILNLKFIDLYKLLNSGDDWSVKLSSDSDYLFSQVSENSELKKIFDELLIKYNGTIKSERGTKIADELNIPTKESNRVFNGRLNDDNISIKKRNVASGTSKLVRINSIGLIKIAKRTSKQKDRMSAPDSVCIPNDLRESFFSDVKGSATKKITGNWELRSEYDKDLYNKWNTLMNSVFHMECGL